MKYFLLILVFFITSCSQPEPGTDEWFKDKHKELLASDPEITLSLEEFKDIFTSQLSDKKIMEKNVVTSKTSAVMVPTKLSNLYASYIDKRQFSSLGSIMWDEFSMHGHYEINGLENFIAAMQQLENYKSTMHQIMNVNGEWQENTSYRGDTYCIASHIFENEGSLHKLDMGIIYIDVIEVRDNKAKFISRDFKLQWQKTVELDELK